MKKRTCLPSSTIWLQPCTTSSFTPILKNCRTTPLLFFDKAYINFHQLAAFGKRDIGYVTRQKDNSIYTSIEEFELPADVPGILKDVRIEVTCKHHKEARTLQMRRVAVFSEKY